MSESAKFDGQSHDYRETTGNIALKHKWLEGTRRYFGEVLSLAARPLRQKYSGWPNSVMEGFAPYYSGRYYSVITHPKLYFEVGLYASPKTGPATKYLKKKMRT